MTAWPLDIPAPERSGSIAPVSTILRRRVQSGRCEVRRFGSGSPDELQATLKLTPAQWTAFKTLFSSTTAMGTVWMTAAWLEDLGYADHMVRFHGYPKVRHRAGLKEIGLSLLIQQTDLVPSEPEDYGWTASEPEAGCTPDPDMAWDAVNSDDTIAVGGTADVAVVGDNAPFVWCVHGQGYSLAHWETDGNTNTLIASEDAIGDATVTVIGCDGTAVTGVLDGTYEMYVETAADDGCAAGGSGFFTTWVFGSSFDTSIRSFFRFRCYLPKGAEIVSAVLKFTTAFGYGQALTPAQVYCHFADADNPLAPTSAAEIYAVPLMPDPVLWAIPPWPGLGGLSTQSADLSSILAAVIARENYTPGDHIMLILTRTNGDGTTGNPRAIATKDSGNEIYLDVAALLP